MIKKLKAIDAAMDKFFERLLPVSAVALAITVFMLFYIAIGVVASGGFPHVR